MNLHGGMHWAYVLGFVPVYVLCGPLWLCVALVVSFSVALARIALVPAPKIEPRRPIEPVFRNNAEWNRAVAELLKPIEQGKSTDLAAVSAAVDRLTKCILDNFVSLWFVNVSQSPRFVELLELELRHVALAVAQRAQAVDLLSFLVFRLLPILNAHYVSFLACDGKLDLAYSVESKLDVARRYKGLNAAVTLSRSKIRVKEKAHFRALVEKALPLMREQSPVLLQLVREILSCTVLTSVYDAVTEGDFCNLMIVKLIGTTLEHRDQVKRLRAALAQHTALVVDPVRLPKSLPPLAGDLNEAKTEMWIAYIGKTTNRQLLRAVELALLRRVSRNEEQAEFASTLAGVLEKQMQHTDALALELLLGSPAQTLAFRGFLAERGAEVLLDFVVAVDDIKAPLEGAGSQISLGFTSTEDIKRIHSDFFGDARLSAFIDDETRKRVQGCDCTKEEQSGARGALFEMQEKVFVKLREHYTLFSNTHRADFESPRKREPSLTEERISPSVMKAVESAFEQIMKPAELETSSLFDADDSDDSADSSMLVASEEKPEAVLVAAPGDLDLAEQVTKLNKEIEALAEQLDIVASLLRKAELINNVAEIGVLRRSRASLEREIKVKELQRLQFTVQEYENSLFGKTSVKIQLYTHDLSALFVLYIIEVQKHAGADCDTVTAGWVVARRYSQFYKLHEHLKARVACVAGIKFPKKAVLNFQKQLVEMRKVALQRYLEALLRLPEVCADPVFRLFLSLEEFSFKRGGLMYDAGDVENLREMQQELLAFERGGTPFVQPIAELLMNVFDLNSSKLWIRGRALLVILQQVLGSAIEKTVKQKVALVRLELRVCFVVEQLTAALFPNGKFREPPPQRLRAEQAATRKEASALFRIFLVESCSRVFGVSNLNRAYVHLFEMFQNDFLNRHLFMEVLDAVSGLLGE